MAKLPKHHDGAELRFFLLTLLRNGRVKADRVRTDDDPRLRSRAAFALITPNSVLPASVESNVASATERDSGRPRSDWTKDTCCDHKSLSRSRIFADFSMRCEMRQKTRSLKSIERVALGPNGTSARTRPETSCTNQQPTAIKFRISAGARPGMCTRIALIGS